MSMTQASIAWRKSPDASVRERGPKVLLGFGIGLAVLMAIASFTPIIYWLFTVPLDAPPDTAALAVDVTRWFIPLPILQAVSFMLRGRLIAMGHPSAVRRAQLIDLVVLFAIVLLATNGPLVSLLHGTAAAPFASLAFDLVLCVDISILVWSLSKVDDRQPHKA